MFTDLALRWLRPLGLASCMALTAGVSAQAQVAPLPPVDAAAAPIAAPAAAPAPTQSGFQPLAVVHRVRAANERMEMTINTSRILTMDQKIPQVQVNNPEILSVTPLSPTEIQISARAPGVTQVNLWGEDKRVYTIDVLVMGDAQALTYLLSSQFPTATLKVIPVANGVLISGYVDKPEHIDLIMKIAEEFYPKVINAITVGGVHQVLLHVKVMEVSRTKLRRLGFDFANFSGGNSVISGISGLIASAGAGAITTTGNQTFAFGVVDGPSAFFGVLEALRQDDLAKILAEPTLVTVSGRPAQFNSGGEFPVPVPQSLGTISIEFKKFGTQLDFVPIVLGNGNIRLEVRPRVSEIDRSRSITVNGTTVPGLRMREVETGVEMRAGQTLAIAGLVYERIEAQNRGVPVLSEIPYLGAAFRKVGEESNTIELLIMVTPELVEPLDAAQVPPCGPGMQTTSPDDCELYLKGHLEVPRCCPAGPSGPACGAPGHMRPMDGMIGPVEEIEVPQPLEGASRGATKPGMATAGKPATRSALLGSTPFVADRRATAAPPNPYNRQPATKPQPAARPAAKNAEQGLIGPLGYDVVN